MIVICNSKIMIIQIFLLFFHPQLIILIDFKNLVSHPMIFLVKQYQPINWQLCVQMNYYIQNYQLMLNTQELHKNRGSTQSVFLGSGFNSTYNHFGPQHSIFRIQKDRGQIIPITQIQEDQFNEEISISPVTAWIVLFYSVLNSAIVPCWLMGDLNSESFTRNSWRYFMLTLLSTPFVLYEQRNLSAEQKKKNSFFKVVKSQNLKIIFMLSLNYMLWMFFLVMSTKFTSMNHAIHLSNIMTFFLSLIREYFKIKNHEFEKGGYVLTLVGVFLIFSDSLLLPHNINAPSNQKYLRVHPLLRFFCGDFLALIAAFVLAFLNYYTPQATSPRFTNFFLYNLMLTMELVTFAYFCGASEFSFNPKFGLFGLFTIDNFVTVFYVSIILGIGLMISNVFVRQIFSSTIIAITSTFQPLLISCLYYILNLQPIPRGLTTIGYSFITPGLLLIIAGQSLIQQVDNKFNFKLYTPKSSRNLRSQHNLKSQKQVFSK